MRTLPQPSVDSLDLTTVLAALADPVRRTLLDAIDIGTEPVACSAAATTVDVGAPTVSHHWRVLREAGLIETTVDGRQRFVRIRRDDLERRFPGLLPAVLSSEQRTTKPATNL